MGEFKTKEDSLLTEQEWSVYSLLSEAYNKFIKLDELHVVDKQEFAQAINSAKNIILSRPASKELAKYNASGYITKEDKQNG